MACWKSVIERTTFSARSAPPRAGRESACTSTVSPFTLTLLRTETVWGSRAAWVDLDRDLDLALAAVGEADDAGGEPEADIGGLGLGGLEQLVVGDGRGAGGAGGRGGAEVAGEGDAAHVRLQIGDADALVGLAGARLEVLDADLDVVQFAARDLGEEREALDGHVRGARQTLAGPQLLGRLVLGEADGHAVRDHEEAAQDHGDDDKYSQCAHVSVFPT